jgi:hypothetical protein
LIQEREERIRERAYERTYQLQPSKILIFIKKFNLTAYLTTHYYFSDFVSGSHIFIKLQQHSKDTEKYKPYLKRLNNKAEKNPYCCTLTRVSNLDVEARSDRSILNDLAVVRLESHFLV